MERHTYFTHLTLPYEIRFTARSRHVTQFLLEYLRSYAKVAGKAPEEGTDMEGIGIVHTKRLKFTQFGWVSRQDVH